MRWEDDHKWQNGKDLEGGVRIEQVNNFNYLGYTITEADNRDLEIEMKRFNQMCSTMTPNNKTRKIHR
jgi:hypothetical protein